MSRSLILTLFFSLFIILFTCCMGPHQMMKVTLTEKFTQSFSFIPPGVDTNDSVKIKTLKSQIINTLGIIIRVNNEEKATSLNQMYIAEQNKGKNKLIDDLRDEKVISKGVSTITLALVPDSMPTRFYVSGNGQYHIVNTNTSKIYYSATFWIEDSNQYLLSDYTEGKDSIIPIFFDQVLVNRYAYSQCDSCNYEYIAWEHKPCSNIRIDIKINRSIIDQYKKPIFGIDYDAQHQVSILGLKKGSTIPCDPGTEFKTIGYIQFQQPQSHYDKVIDLRGVRLFTRKDYNKYKQTYEGK